MLFFMLTDSIYISAYFLNLLCVFASLDCYNMSPYAFIVLLLKITQSLHMQVMLLHTSA